MFFDTEKRSDVYVVDNQNSNTRFRFTGDAKISPTLSAGFLIEVAAAPHRRVEQGRRDERRRLDRR